MNTAVTLLPRLAGLLEYPGPDLLDQVEQVRGALALQHPELAARLEPLALFAAEQDQAALEETYTRTFDISAPCCLEIGWQLFGENYHRGSLLVKLRMALREHGIDPGSELPDHLVPVLRLIAVLPAEFEPADLAHEGVLPALTKMRAALAETANPWSCVLEVVEAMVIEAFGPAPAEVMEV